MAHTRLLSNSTGYLWGCHLAPFSKWRSLLPDCRDVHTLEQGEAAGPARHLCAQYPQSATGTPHRGIALWYSTAHQAPGGGICKRGPHLWHAFSRNLTYWGKTEPQKEQWGFYALNRSWPYSAEPPFSLGFANKKPKLFSILMNYGSCSSPFPFPDLTIH